jgi:hypothetical protein
LALLGTLYLSNLIEKRITKFCETIPLNKTVHVMGGGIPLNFMSLHDTVFILLVTSYPFLQRNQLKKIMERINLHRKSLGTLRSRWEKLECSRKEDDIDLQPLLAFVTYYVECFSQFSG